MDYYNNGGGAGGCKKCRESMIRTEAEHRCGCAPAARGAGAGARPDEYTGLKRSIEYRPTRLPGVNRMEYYINPSEHQKNRETYDRMDYRRHTMEHEVKKCGCEDNDRDRDKRVNFDAGRINADDVFYEPKKSDCESKKADCCSKQTACEGGRAEYRPAGAVYGRRVINETDLPHKSPKGREKCPHCGGYANRNRRRGKRRAGFMRKHYN